MMDTFHKKLPASGERQQTEKRLKALSILAKQQGIVNRGCIIQKYRMTMFNAENCDIMGI